MGCGASKKQDAKVAPKAEAAAAPKASSGSESEVNTKAFKSYDRDNNKLIDLNELKAVAVDLHLEAADLLKAFDVDKDGGLNFEEFKALMKVHGKKLQEKHDRLKTRFAALDSSRAGKLSDMKVLAKESGWEASEILKKFDANHDGAIDFEEFVNFCRALDANYAMINKKAFTSYDANHDKMLDTSELKAIAVDLHLDVDQLLKDFDSDKDGRLNFDEFYKLMRVHSKKLQDKHDRLKARFASLDSSRSGKLSANDLKPLAKESGWEAADILKKFDVNRDGAIDFEEFVAYCRALDANYAMINKKAFTSYDSNRDNFIDSNELKAIAVDLHADAHQLLKDFDFDKDGKLSFDEFYKLMRVHSKKLQDKHDRLKAKFASLDASRSGKLVANDLKALAKETGWEPAEIIKKFDANRDGAIDFDEFVNFCRAVDANYAMINKKAFASYDVNHDQMLDAGELKAIAVDLHLDVDQLLKDFDGDHDGKLNFDEFYKLMRVHSKKLQDKHDRLKARFASLDSSRTGKLSVSDLKPLVKESGWEAADILKKFDLDHDGAIEFEEFVAYCRALDANYAMINKKAFTSYDVNRDKFLDLNELKTIAVDLHIEAEDLLKEFDSDKDGKLNYDEFYKLMRAHSKKLQDKHDRIKAKFASLDKSHGGKINGGELSSLAKESGWEVAEILKKFDTNRDSALDFDEFVAYSRALDANYAMINKKAFTSYDVNHDKMLDPSELKAIGVDLHLGVDQLLKEFDADKDGKLNYDEFYKLMRAHGKKLQDKHDRLKARFASLDKSRGGKVNGSELNSLVKESGWEVAEILKKFDSNHDGALDFGEFVNYCRAMDLKYNEINWKAFVSYDLNGDRFLDANELKPIATILRLPADQLLKEFDGDRDGRLNFDEFYKLMRVHSKALQDEYEGQKRKFASLDGNATKKLTSTELKPVADELGITVEQILKDFDADHDGRINFTEYVALIRAYKK